MNQLALGAELRRLGMMADRGIMGVGFLTRGETREPLLRAGVEFCTELATALTSSASRDLPEPAATYALTAILGTEKSASRLRELNINPAALQQSRDTLQTALTGPQAHQDQDQLRQVQTLLNGLSAILHDADISNLQALKERRGLESYG